LDVLTGVLLLLLVANFVVTMWLVFQWRSSRMSGADQSVESALQLVGAEIIGKQTESLLGLRRSLDDANRLLNERLAEGTSSIDRRMAVLGEIENRLGQLSAQATAIEDVGRNIQSLSELLRPPKLRGAIGEIFLENILSQILPTAMYSVQHRFESGARVDAAIRLGRRWLPIDAKFPMEAFERLKNEPESQTFRKEFASSLRKHIDDIAGKYIRPGEDTTEFALMYIPAEAVYHELVNQENEDILNYAFSQRVIPSCPGHLYAFLSSVATVYAELSLAGSTVTESTRRLLAGVSALVETTDRLAGFHDRMESSLRTLSTGFDRARRELSQARQQLDRLREPQATTPDADNSLPIGLSEATAQVTENPD
jgi:DNA recombination protein RmuC